MLFSIIITTVDRVKEIRELFASLEKQRCKNFQLILGDQSIDHLLNKELNKYSFNSKYIPLPKCSLSKARNLLLNYVEGDVIVLGDDDCIYHPDFFDQMESIVIKHPQAAAFVCAPSVNLKNHKVKIMSRWSLFYQAPSISILLRTSFVHRAGRFDEQIGIGADTPWQSGEETDMLLRIQALGGIVLRCLSIQRPWHPDPDFSQEATIRKAYAYGLGRMFVLHKHQFPFWFKFFNVLFPLLIFPIDIYQKKLIKVNYRWAIFCGRLRGFWWCYLGD